jgi:hypothetical protein
MIYKITILDPNDEVDRIEYVDTNKQAKAVVRKVRMIDKVETHKMFCSNEPCDCSLRRIREADYRYRCEVETEFVPKDAKEAVKLLRRWAR